MTEKVIIIGAPRSGTNILRDVLTSFQNIITWPCDEINYIWRHGNIEYPSDEFSPAMATKKVKGYIRNKFNSIAKKFDGQIILEKTCASSLRVGFVDAIFPDAKYIFIIRDGRDVVPTAMDRWKGIMELPYLPYIMQKVRFVPFRDLPYYALKYFIAQVHRAISKEGRLSYWGPRFDGIEDYCRNHSLSEICAMQWRRCVERSEEDFATIEKDRVYRVFYENLVSNPIDEIKKISNFLNLKIPKEEFYSSISKISPKFVGSWKTDLPDYEFKKVLPIMDSLLKQYGYA